MNFSFTDDEVRTGRAAVEAKLRELTDSGLPFQMVDDGVIFCTIWLGCLNEDSGGLVLVDPLGVVKRLTDTLRAVTPKAAEPPERPKLELIPGGLE